MLHRTTRPLGLNPIMYNIWDSRSFAPPQPTGAMQLGKYNMVLLTYKKIPKEAYFHNHLGYNVVCYQAVVNTARGVQVGVGMVVRERSYRWSVELTRFHRGNMVICEIVSGGQQTPIIGAYLPLSTLEHLPDMK